MQASNNQQDGNQGGKPTLSWTSPQQKIALPQNSPAKTGTTNNKQKSNFGLYTGIFAGGLIVGVLIGWGIVSSRQSSTATTMTYNTNAASTTTTTATPAATAATMDLSGSAVGGTAALSISSPQDAGLNVAVSHVRVSSPTWVVIYEDQNGNPGNVLGASLFFPASEGGAESGVVPLLRGTLPGQTYLAGEALDDGDHKFSLDTDKPVRDDKGNPVLVEFKTN